MLKNLFCLVVLVLPLVAQAMSCPDRAYLSAQRAEIHKQLENLSAVTGEKDAGQLAELDNLIAEQFPAGGRQRHKQITEVFGPGISVRLDLVASNINFVFSLRTLLGGRLFGKGEDGTFLVEKLLKDFNEPVKKHELDEATIKGMRAILDKEDKAEQADRTQLARLMEKYAAEDPDERFASVRQVYGSKVATRVSMENSIRNFTFFLVDYLAKRPGMLAEKNASGEYKLIEFLQLGYSVQP